MTDAVAKPDFTKDVLTKVPAVTLGFWIIKILATTLGETGGDTVSMTWLGEAGPEIRAEARACVEIATDLPAPEKWTGEAAEAYDEARQRTAAELSGGDESLDERLEATADLAEALIACPSVTPAAGLVFDCLEAQLAPLGFAVHRFSAGVAPDGPVENAIASVFEEVLGSQVQDATASFFEIGGHSLLATLAIARLRENVGLAVDVETFFAAPSVGGLAKLADADLTARLEIVAGVAGMSENEVARELQRRLEK